MTDAIQVFIENTTDIHTVVTMRRCSRLTQSICDKRLSNIHNLGGSGKTAFDAIRDGDIHLLTALPDIKAADLALLYCLACDHENENEE